MTWRALFVGFLLGILIAGSAYFNDHVIEQTFIIGSHLPPAVFGFGLVVVLMINPILRRVGRIRAFKPAELALILAMALAVCAWPSAGFFRTYTHLVAYPARSLPVQSNWQATQVIGYVPGAAPILAEGYVTDWTGLIAALRQADHPEAPRVSRRLFDRLDPLARQAVAQADDRSVLGTDDRRRILAGINEALKDPTFFDPTAMADLPLSAEAAALVDAAKDRPLRFNETVALNRAAVETAIGGFIAPPPHGDGVLLLNGQSDPKVADPLFGGARTDGTVGPADVPWRAWWPTHRLWIGAALLIGLATLAMILIVHPQWTRREQLIYPTVQFAREITGEAGEDARPAVIRSRLFWIGVCVCAIVHGCNGLHAWFPLFPDIPRRVDLNPLRQLLPGISQMHGSRFFFHPEIFFAAIGFAFLINAKVAMSVGLSNAAFLALGALMMSFGEPLGNNRFNIEDEGGAMRFGAYLGMAGMILYLGRRHYLNVAAASVGFKRLDETPPYTVWAARMMVMAVAGAVYLLARYGGLDLMMAAMLVGLILIVGLVMTRINVETGLFYAQPDFVPAIMLAGLLGIEGIGPTTMLVLLFGSFILAGGQREALGPFLANGLAMTQRVGATPARRAIWPVAAMVIVGLAVALIAAFTIQYNMGLNTDDHWARSLPHHILNQTSASIDDLNARGRLAEATQVSGWERLAFAQPNGRTVGWMAIGLALVALCAALRLRFAGWPLHPILFLVWGTWPASNFAFSFLLAAVLKVTLQKIGGERLVRTVRPMMIGLIAGDLLMVIFWSTVGTTYFAVYESVPNTIRIFPD